MIFKYLIVLFAKMLGNYWGMDWVLDFLIDNQLYISKISITYFITNLIESVWWDRNSNFLIADKLHN